MCKEWAEDFENQLGKTAGIQLKLLPEWMQSYDVVNQIKIFFDNTLV